MNPQIDIISKTLRAAAILTTSYVGALVSSVLTLPERVQDYNQLIIYVDFTIGSLTSAEIKVEFNPAGAADLYQETDETAAVTSNVDTKAVNTVIRQLSVTGKYRIAIPICEGDVKISIKGTGTVTSSSAKIAVGLGKTFA